jgi:TusA-related sulfurtransferase
MNRLIEESTVLDIRGLCWGPPVLAIVGKLKSMKEQELVVVISDKVSMLSDIPAICRLAQCALLKTFRMDGLLLFIIQNKKWA